MASKSSKYVGRLAYFGSGYYGTIVEYEYSEALSNDGKSPTAFTETWTIHPKGRPSDVHVVVDDKNKIVVLESIKFNRIQKFGPKGQDVIFCVISVAGQAYTGWAIRHPEEDPHDSFGRRLALARAVDYQGIKALLEEDQKREEQKLENSKETGAEHGA